MQYTGGSGVNLTCRFISRKQHSKVLSEFILKFASWHWQISSNRTKGSIRRLTQATLTLAHLGMVCVRYWLGYNETVGRVDAVRQDNIITNIYFVVVRSAGELSACR